MFNALNHCATAVFSALCSPHSRTNLRPFTFIPLDITLYLIHNTIRSTKQRRKTKIITQHNNYFYLYSVSIIYLFIYLHLLDVCDNDAKQYPDIYWRFNKDAESVVKVFHVS